MGIKKRLYSWKQYNTDIEKIYNQIKLKGLKVDAIYGIPKGGLIAGVHLANLFDVPLITNYKDFSRVVKSEKILVIDDVSDTGSTFLKIKDIDKCYTVTLCIKYKTNFIPDIYGSKHPQDEWIEYSWECLNG